jgi:preprotein translocase SecE subunit
MLFNNRLFNYIKESKVELQKVVWPKKNDVYKHTMIVIGVSLATAVFLGIFDYIFSKILERFI